MDTMHENCPHPRRKVQRFGGKRRRCRECGKTWTAHPRRRGRRPLRLPPKLLMQLLVAGVPTSHLASSYGCSRWSLQKRCQNASRRLANKPHDPPVPDGGLILIADALRLTCQRQEYAIYSMAVKPTDRSIAFFLEPVLLAGRESARGWRQAIDRIGPTIRQRIRALVSDGLPGAGMICRQNRWVHQRCHWHILAPFTGSRNRRRRVRTLLRKTRDVAYKAIRLAINTTNQETLRLALGVLQTLIPMIPHRAWKFPGIIRQFTQDIDDFRAYQLHPELGLPATTGVVESLHAKMRPITSRVHNPEAIRRRVACLVRLFPSMRCNRRHYQQN